MSSQARAPDRAQLGGEGCRAAGQVEPRDASDLDALDR
jgi:hypothetical protein